MTKSPTLVFAVCAVFSLGSVTHGATAAKSSKSSSKRSTPTKKASSTAAKPAPEAPKALAVSSEEISKAKASSSTSTASTSAATAKASTKTSNATATSAGKEKDTVATVAKADTPKQAVDNDNEKDKDAEGGPQSKAEKKKPAAVSTMTPEELAGFDTYPPALQEVVRKALELTTQNLRYEFGSSDPKNGGMDCSGTMCCVLQDAGVKGVPRQSDEICRWVMRRSVLYRTENTSSLKSDAFSALHPGDLLFWTGTYDTGGQREVPVSHVMMYLGKRKKDGKPIVFGSSDGRSYNGERRNGVSIFDFSLPQRGGKAAFYGYGPIPGLPKEEVRRAIVRAVPAYAVEQRVSPN